MVCICTLTAANTGVKSKNAPPKATVLKTDSGWEFKNVVFAEGDLEALMRIYQNGQGAYKVAQAKNNEVVEVYGTADISQVSIMSKNESSPTAMKGNAIIKKKISFGVFEENFVVWETKSLNAVQKRQVDAIMGKYAVNTKNITD